MLLLIAALLTVAVEVPVFALMGYRKPVELLFCAAVNLLTNLSLNLLLMLLAILGIQPEPLSFLIYPLELCVVLAEYRLYRCVLERSRRLLFTVILCNTLSYAAGVLLLGHL